MKKLTVFLILLIFSTVTFAQVTWPISNRNVSDPRRLRILLQSRFDNLDDDIAGSSFYNIGTGNIRYVDSGRSNAATIDGLTKTKAEPTLEAAFAQATNGLTANNGDTVYCMQGHTEALATADAVDCDVAGVTIVCLGSGTAEATFTYTAAAGEFVIGAANITMYGGRFTPLTDDVTMGISVEAAADNFTHINPHFPEPVTVGNCFVDCYDLESTAHDFRVYGAIYRCTSPTTGPAHFIDAGNGVNHNMKVIGCDIQGYFSVSAIWSDTLDEDAMIAYNVIRNKTAGQHVIEFTGNATGFIMYNAVYTNLSASSIDPGAMNVIENYLSTSVGSSGQLYPAAGW
jgi:hypothetical protein